MSSKKSAKLFRNGRSQAVRLPRDFRFEGSEVRIRKVRGGVLLEPMLCDVTAWFVELDSFGAEPSFKIGRRQPRAPRRQIFE